MINTDLVKNKIISFLQKNGPSLPIQIGKDLGMNSLFTSAFLSELLDSKKIKNSSLRVGGTTLYLLPGQEPQLEKFHTYLPQKEIEAYESLKNNRILKDSEQEPAIRVALRSIKDFAFSFKNDDQLYWRYLTTSEQEVRDIFSKPNKNPIEIIKEKEPEIKKEPQELIIQEIIAEKIIEPEIKKIKEETIKKPKETTLYSFNNPLAIKQEPKQEKIKPKSEFVLKIISYLENNDFKILEEKEYSKKEYNCIAEIETKLGPIAFLTQAKEKKSIADSDLDLLLRQAQSIPLPALFIYPETLSKKAIEYQNKFYSIIKTLKAP